MNNLDDIAFVMDILADIRAKEIKQDMTLMQCEVSVASHFFCRGAFSLLGKFANRCQLTCQFAILVLL